MQDELVMVSGMPILNGLSNQLPLTFKNKSTSKISTWGSSSFLFPSSSDPTFLLLVDFAKIHFVHSAGDQHVSEIALMALDLLAGDLIIIIIIICISLSFYYYIISYSEVITQHNNCVDCKWYETLTLPFKGFVVFQIPHKPNARLAIRCWLCLLVI